MSEKITFTNQQQKVLDARGHNVLVSAAAGSGKTAVLVERIIREISEKDEDGRGPLDIDRLLVVTFTRAAAAQMREKIAKAVSKKLEEEPDNRHLQRQETLLHHAQITTIDSFCTFLLRNNFSEIGLDPGFRQMDETENTLLVNDVMGRFLEAQYAAKDPDFLACVDYFCPGDNDAALEDLILRLYRTADSHPYPEAWLSEHAEDYAVKDAADLMSKEWYVELLEDQADGLDDIMQLYKVMLQVSREPDGPFPYLDVLEREEEELGERIRKAAKLKQEIRNDNKAACYGGEETINNRLRKALLVIAEYPLAKLPVIRNAEKQGIDTAKKEQVQALRKQLKTRLGAMDAFLSEDPDLTVYRMQQAEQPVRTLVDLTLGFMEALDTEKKERNVLSFSDVEHDALKILIDRKEDGMLTLRKAAEEYRRHFAEVLIDEYQDSNEVQELLLCAIAGEKDAGFVMGESTGRYARFMVGDVKQSIYRFRNARPEIFQRKFDTYDVLPDTESESVTGAGNQEESGGDYKSDPAHFGKSQSGGRENGSKEREEKEGTTIEDIIEGEAESAGVRTKKETSSYERGKGDRSVQRERIDLDQNFRSRTEVLDSVNAVFTKIMRREIGGVEYDETVSLKPGATYPEPVMERGGIDPYRTELLIVDGAAADRNDPRDAASSDKEKNKDSRKENSGGDEDSIENEIAEMSGQKKEALAVAQRIREIVGKLPVTDEETGKQRMTRYGDIVILLRSASGRQDSFREIFEKEGIPLYMEYKGGYFAAEEVRQVLQVLRVLDNPRQDIPLYGAMRGYFGGFSEDEIGQIRAAEPDREDLLYDCLLEAAGESTRNGEKNENVGEDAISGTLQAKCRDFLGWLSAYRAKVPTTPIHELIGDLIRSTGYENYVRALPAGQRRAANLHSLLVKAAAFEQTEYAGLFRFLRYIDQMHEFDVDYGEANVLDEHADVVRLTTIHKSKGLEYPICFVCGLGEKHPFTRDLSGMLITDSDMGIGVNYVDTNLRSMTKTLRQKAVAEKIARDSLGEELRVLYVAMTRAKEKLILTGFVRDGSKFENNIASQMASVALPAKHLPVSVIRAASGYLPLIAESLEAMKAEKHASSGGSFSETSYTEKAGLSKENEILNPVRVIRVPVSDLALSKVEDQVTMGAMKDTLVQLENGGLEQLPVPTLSEKLSRRFNWRYPYENMSGLFTKTTVSELKHAAMVDAGILSDDTAAEGPFELYPDRLYEEESFSDSGSSSNKKNEVTDNQTVSGFECQEENGKGRLLSALLQKPGDDTLPKPHWVQREELRGSEFGGTGKGAEIRNIARETEISGAARGTAIHRMCELIDYHAWSDPASVTAKEFEDKVNELAGHGEIPAESTPVLTPGVFLPFLKSGIAARMADADSHGLLRREQPFVLGIPANRLNPAFPPEETILIQGIIDAFFIEENDAVKDGAFYSYRESDRMSFNCGDNEDNTFSQNWNQRDKNKDDANREDYIDGEPEPEAAKHIVVVDYKTDRVHTARQLIDRYQVQLDYYAEALEKMLGLPVTEKIIYSFQLQEEIRLL